MPKKIPVQSEPAFEPISDLVMQRATGASDALAPEVPGGARHCRCLQRWEHLVRPRESVENGLARQVP